MLNAGNPRRGYGHDRAGNMAVAAAGDVAPCRGDGDQALTGHQTGDNLHLDILDGIPLTRGEAANVVVGEGNVVLELLAHLCRGSLDLLLAEQQRALVLIEARSVGARDFFAPSLDLIEDFLNGIAD